MEELRNYIEKGFNSLTIDRSYKVQDLEIIILEGNGPTEGAQSYSTFGLSKIQLVNKSGEELDFGIEIISSAYPVNMAIFDYPRILASAYFRFAKEASMGPGNVLLNAVKEFCPTIKNKPHLYFTIPPYYWDHGFDDIVVSNKTVKFLCAFPITDSEYKLLEEKGYDYFEDYIYKDNNYFFDVDRTDSL